MVVFFKLAVTEREKATYDGFTGKTKDECDKVTHTTCGWLTEATRQTVILTLESCNIGKEV